MSTEQTHRALPLQCCLPPRSVGAHRGSMAGHARPRRTKCSNRLMGEVARTPAWRWQHRVSEAGCCHGGQAAAALPLSVALQLRRQLAGNGGGGAAPGGSHVLTLRSQRSLPPFSPLALPSLPPLLLRPSPWRPLAKFTLRRFLYTGAQALICKCRACTDFSHPSCARGANGCAARGLPVAT